MVFESNLAHDINFKLYDLHKLFLIDCFVYFIYLLQYIYSSAAYSSLVTTATTSYLVILKASSNSSDYQISTSVQLYLPPSSPSDSLRTNMKSSTGCLSTTASPNAIRWSPHEHSNQLAIAFDNGILGWDVRCMK